MTQRDKMIEILSRPIYPKEGIDKAEVVADHLIDNGVVVLPCMEWLKKPCGRNENGVL